MRGFVIGAAVLLIGELSADNAEAFVGVPSVPTMDVASVAMCGSTCRSGGRYIPGPASVCAGNGLLYCGPSIESRPRTRDPLVACRRVMIERPDGRVSRMRCE
jgi:hypothetical protein